MNKAILQGQHDASRMESALNQDSLGQSGQQGPSRGACIVPVIPHRRQNNGPCVLSPAPAGPFCAAGDRQGGAARHAVHPAEPPSLCNRPRSGCHHCPARLARKPILIVLLSPGHGPISVSQPGTEHSLDTHGQSF